MDNNINVIVTGPEQIMGFNDFQSLVHHSSRIQCNFGTHIPVRVCRSFGLDESRFFLTHSEQFVFAQIPKRTTGCGQNDPSQSTFGDALQTLKNGRMFTVRRKLGRTKSVRTTFLIKTDWDIEAW